MKWNFAPLLLAAALLSAAPSFADTVVKNDQVRAELLTEHATVSPGDTVWLGLQMDIQPGWHAYWRTTGDSGFPTSITWTLPEGVTAGDIVWPTPERVKFGDLVNYGYDTQVVLLTEVKIAADAAKGDAILKAEASWLVCADVCIPQDATFELPLKIDPSAPKSNTAASATIATWRDKVPTAAPWAVKATRSGNAIELMLNTKDVKSVEFLPYDTGLIVNAAPQPLAVNGDGATLKLTADKGSESIGDVKGVLRVTDASGAVHGYDFTSPLTWTAGGAQGGEADLSFALALVFAFLGGLVLNVMPCVLPVLTMKAMSFTRSGITPQELRRDGLAYTAGVMVAFTALVGVLLGLRAAGSAVGWGFQLQSPIFVAVLAYVMFALGLNLSGVFQINGPMNAGDSLTRKGGAAGAFFTGLLAVLVATPCTAPFMGAAVGFAFTLPPVLTIVIFEALALGLAAPFLLLTFIPSLAKMMPKPGTWMERVKQVLAFPMYGTAAWLVWVMAQQLDVIGLGLAFAGVVTLGFAAWLWGVAQVSAERGERWSTAFAVVMLLVTAGFVYGLGDRPATAAAQTAEGPGTLTAEPYNAEKLVAWQKEGRPVFVDFTAAWCLTCIVNEKAALASADVADAFKTKNVVYVKADWTNRNKDISNALRALGRDGVPLYAYYPPGGAAPKILPQILTPAIVLDVIAGS